MENVSKGKNNFYYQSKLKFKLEKDENEMFKKIFNDLYKDNYRYLRYQTVHDFIMERTDLSEEILNRIKTTCKIQNDRFYENEFYIALRLVALAQNNFPFTEQEIINNNPIPPLPVFKEPNDNSNRNNNSKNNNNNNNNPIPPLSVFKGPNKYPIYPDDIIDIYKIYDFLKKFEENMNNKYEKLNKRIEEINKDNKKIISFLKIYEKEKRTINLSNHNLGHNGHNFAKINNSNNNIKLPLQKISIKQVCHSPPPKNKNYNFKKLPNYNNYNINEEKEKKLNDKNLQYYPKKIGENQNLNLANGNIFNWSNNIQLSNPENINNNLMDKGPTNKNITPFGGSGGEKNEMNFNS